MNGSPLLPMVHALLLRLDVYAKLSHEDRAALEKLSRTIRHVPARRDLVREGDAPRTLHLLLEGWACCYKTLPDGRRQILAFFVPGDFCDLNVYVLKQMDHSVGAITGLKVAEVTRDDMDWLTTTHPRVTRALWWQELVSGSIQREWTLNVGQRTAYERISHLLAEIFLRLENVGLTRGQSCEFPLTQNDIADATGLTAVHVNRTLQDLRRDGIIVLQGRNLTVPDMDRLKTAGLFNSNYLHLERKGGQLEPSG